MAVALAALTPVCSLIWSIWQHVLSFLVPFISFHSDDRLLPSFYKLGRNMGWTYSKAIFSLISSKNDQVENHEDKIRRFQLIKLVRTNMHDESNGKMV